MRPIEEVVVICASPESPRGAPLVTQLDGEGVRARLGDRTALPRADILCTCTTSTEPLFAAGELSPGTHVNVIGSHRPEMCELPGSLLAEALLVVETERAARAGAGEIIRTIDAGLLPAEDFAADLALLAARRVGRRDPAQMTVFKSVGLSVEDLILARALAERPQ